MECHSLPGIPPFGRRWHSLYLLGGLGEEVLPRPLARRVGHRDYGGPVLGSACNIRYLKNTYKIQIT